MNIYKDKIKLIATDLDGTLLASDGSISTANRNALLEAKKNGVEIVIATGRAIYESISAIKAIGASNYIISLSGANVYDLKNKKRIHSDCLEREAVLEAVKVLERYSVFYQIYFSETSITSEKSFNLLDKVNLEEGYAKITKKNIVITDNIIEAMNSIDNIEKLFIKAISLEQRDEIRREIQKVVAQPVLNSLDTAIEILTHNSNKGSGLNTIRKVLGLSKNEVLAIGDSENDIDLFNEAGHCVAVNNAFDSLKEKADYIVSSNNDDGVAYAVSKYVLSDYTKVS